MGTWDPTVVPSRHPKYTEIQKDGLGFRGVMFRVYKLQLKAFSSGIAIAGSSDIR